MVQAREMTMAEVGWAAPAAPGRVRLRTLTLIRWGAVAGQAAAILVVHFGLGFALPLVAALSVVGASALLNAAIAFHRPAGGRLGEEAARWYLAYDVVQLAVLLYLTGGLGNPFAFLLLAPVTVSATILSARSTVALCVLALACITALAVRHLPLPWGGGGLALPLTYVLGVWVALAFGIAFFAAYTYRVVGEAKRMSDALAATQLALAREQQMFALGGLAAAAAHELGNPLGTIAVVARELARELPKDGAAADDVELLISEIGRCRDILSELGRRPAAAGEPFERLPVDALVEAAVARHRDARIALRLDAGAAGGDSGAPPQVARSPEIIHGLGNLVQNAVQFADSEVAVKTRWSAAEITVTIRDDGPGFPARLLERLGEPYVSMRPTEGEHMGLGVFIAKTLLHRTGAEVAFANGPGGGAEVVVRWPRGALDAAGDAPAGTGENRPT